MRLLAWKNRISFKVQILVWSVAFIFAQTPLRKAGVHLFLQPIIMGRITMIGSSCFKWQPILEKDYTKFKVMEKATGILPRSHVNSQIIRKIESVKELHHLHHEGIRHLKKNCLLKTLLFLFFIFFYSSPKGH